MADAVAAPMGVGRSSNLRCRGARRESVECLAASSPLGYSKWMAGPPVTVVETARFLADAAACLSEEERRAVVDSVAADPTAGVLVPDGGGIRKLRVSARGKGKSGGARVIYFFHSRSIPVFLLAAYGKSERSDLSAVERRALAAVVKLIPKAYGRRGSGARS